MSQRIPSLTPKRPVSRCASVLFVSQKPDVLPVPWKLFANLEQRPGQGCPTFPAESEMDLLRRRKL